MRGASGSRRRLSPRDGHFLWDTTAYADGPHRLRFVVYDVIEQSGSMEIDVTVANLDGGTAVDAGARDGGAMRDAGASADGGAIDAGPSVMAGGSCSCRVATHATGRSAMVLGVLIATALARRRRRL